MSGVGRADCVAIHRGVIKRRNVEGRDGVLGEHLAEAVEQRERFRLERVEIGEDTIAGFFDANHACLTRKLDGRN